MMSHRLGRSADFLLSKQNKLFRILAKTDPKSGLFEKFQVSPSSEFHAEADSANYIGLRRA